MQSGKLLGNGTHQLHFSTYKSLQISHLIWQFDFHVNKYMKKWKTARNWQQFLKRKWTKCSAKQTARVPYLSKHTYIRVITISPQSHFSTWLSTTQLKNFMSWLNGGEPQNSHFTISTISMWRNDPWGPGINMYHHTHAHNRARPTELKLFSHP